MRLTQLSGNDRNPDFAKQWANFYGSEIKEWWLTWASGEEANTNIYVMRNDDEEWSGEPYPITSNSLGNNYPDIECFGDSTFVVWQSDIRGNSDILYSIFDGVNWSSPAFVTQDSLNNHKPQLYTFKTSESTVDEALVVWERANALMWSTFDGGDWSLPNMIPISLDSVRNPVIDGSHYPAVVFEGLQEGNWDIYTNLFVPDSNYWHPPFRITEDEAEDRNPTIALAEIFFHTRIQRFKGHVWLAWETNRDGNWEIYTGIFRLDDGVFEFRENLSNSDWDDFKPTGIIYLSGDVYLILTSWQSNRSGQDQIFVGETFNRPIYLANVTSDTFENHNPAFSNYVGREFWLAWESFRNEQWDIWGIKLENVTSVNQAAPLLPDDYRLFQNYPNPFNRSTTIVFELPVMSRVSLTIYDLRGRKVKDLVNRNYDAGTHHVVWNGNDTAGNKVSSGLYLVHMQAGDFSLVKKIISVK